MEAFDPRTRELCPDDACIGLIGPDGKCKECGAVSPNVVSNPRNVGLTLEEEEDSFGDERELCPDETCIGVIGDDGRCKECGLEGRRGAGKAAADDGDDGDLDEDEDWDDEDSDRDPDNLDQDQDQDQVQDQAGGDWETRRLCEDGGCIGVIGADGRCKVCGSQGS